MCPVRSVTHVSGRSFALRCENVRALAGKNYALLKEDPRHASHEHAHR
jgi:hypothetical protein